MAAALAPSTGRMSGLLSEGLCVRHIAHLGLIKCKATDDTDDVLSDPALAEFDQIPVAEDNRIVGIVERKGWKRRPLDESLLVSADEHLARFIFTLNSQQY